MYGMRSLRPEVPEEDYFVMNGGAIAVAVAKKLRQWVFGAVSSQKSFWRSSGDGLLL